MSQPPRLRPFTRRPDAVGLIWIGGIALALLAYAVGPERVVASALEAFRNASLYLDAITHRLTATTLGLIRAVAIGLFGTFVGLSLLGMRRGGHGAGSLVLVAIVFVLLVWGAQGFGPGANARWAAALVVAAAAALSATRRLSRG